MATLPTAPIPPSADHDVPVYPHRDSYLATGAERQAEHRRNAILLIFVAGVVEFLLLLTFWGLVRIITGMGADTMWWFTIITFLPAWVATIALGLARVFLISVPEATAALVVKMFFRSPKADDYFDGQEVFTTGLWWKGLFWQVKDGLYINLRQVEETIEEDTPALGQGGPGSGPLVHHKSVVTWQADAKLLPLHVMVDQDVIADIIAAIGKDALRPEIANMSPPEVTANQEKLGGVLRNAYSVVGRFTTALQMLGITIRRAVLVDAQAEENYQTALTEQARAERTKVIAESFKAKDGSMSDADALRLALIQQGIVKENVDRTILGVDEATRNVLSVEAIVAIINALRSKEE